MSSKKRNKPCTECRQLRRKCTFATNSTECLRCLKLNKVCTIKASKYSSQSDDDENEIEDMKQTVRELEWTILQLQDEMDSINRLTASPPPAPTTINKSITRIKNNTNETQKLLEAMIKSLMFTWKIQIKNGVFQIETGIRNINDLLRFQMEREIQYISPLSNMISKYSNDSDTYRGETGVIIKFGNTLEPGTDALPFTVKLLTICAKQDVPSPEALLLPCNLLIDPLDIMDRLIHIYFACHNVITPMLHEKVFMSKYNRMEDPFTDPLALSICSYVCSTPCDHLYYGVKERRSMSDYFFLKAKNIILDQFDIPEKRLENMMCINILTKYMKVTVKFKECRKLTMLAYQICLDLKNQFPKPSFESFTGDVNIGDGCDSDTYNKYLDYVLYSRHVTAVLCTRRLMDYISNSPVDDTTLFFARWLYLNDEPEDTKRFVTGQNWVLGMFNHPFIGNIMNQILKIHIGLECKLTFESIVRLEDVIDEWYSSMPSNLRITTQYKSEEISIKAIEETSDSLLLMSFLHFHLFVVSLYSSLVQPIALGEDNDLLLPLVQEVCLAHALKGCRILLHIVYRMFKLDGLTKCEYALSGCEFLFHTIDVILLLSLSRNPYISSEATKILKNCMVELNEIDYIKQYRVPIETSPIHLGLMDLDNPTTYHLNYYDQFPQPWYAMVYDASYYIAFSKNKV